MVSGRGNERSISYGADGVFIPCRKRVRNKGNIQEVSGYAARALLRSLRRGVPRR
jgi:hypothetical protein